MDGTSSHVDFDITPTPSVARRSAGHRSSARCAFRARRPSVLKSASVVRETVIAAPGLSCQRVRRPKDLRGHPVSPLKRSTWVCSSDPPARAGLRRFLFR